MMNEINQYKRFSSLCLKYSDFQAFMEPSYCKSQFFHSKEFLYPYQLDNWICLCLIVEEIAMKRFRFPQSYNTLSNSHVIPFLNSCHNLIWSLLINASFHIQNFLNWSVHNSLKNNLSRRNPKCESIKFELCTTKMGAFFFFWNGWVWGWNCQISRNYAIQTKNSILIQ